MARPLHEGEPSNRFIERRLRNDLGRLPSICSDRYHAQSLVIQGPGAGTGHAAAALLDDALDVLANYDARLAARATPKKVSIGCGRWNTYPCA